MKVTQLSIAIIAAYTVIVLLQWMHFSVYFKQPVGISLVWSLVDWFVWFGLLAALWFSTQRWRMIQLFIAFVLIAGPLHILISSSFYQILFDADKTLMESFFHLMNKRWLQNLLTASFMSLLIIYVGHLRLQKQVSSDSKPNMSERLSLSDGSNTYYLHEDEILAVVSSKNYLSVFTSEREIVIRDTLKGMQARLDNTQFVQISRSALVNLKSIKHIERYSRNSYRAVLSNQSEINIGRTFYRTVQDYLHMSHQQLHSSQ